MPILESLAYYGIISWFIPAAGKEIVQLLMKTQCWISYVSKYSMNSKPNDLFDYGKEDEKDNVVEFNLITIISLAIEENKYGLQIICAPPGSGKSTYLKYGLNSLKSQRPLKIFKGGSYLLSMNKIRDSFGIPHHVVLSDYIPKGSIIIIDQVDFTGDAFNETIQSNITELATDSYNSKKYLVILSISNASFALKTLGCNGGEKINITFSPKDIQWTANEANKYFLLKQMEQNDIEDLLDLFKPRYSPKIMRDYILKRNRNQDIFKKRVNEKNKQWDEFETILTTDLIDRYLI